MAPRIMLSTMPHDIIHYLLSIMDPISLYQLTFVSKEMNVLAHATILHRIRGSRDPCQLYLQENCFSPYLNALLLNAENYEFSSIHVDIASNSISSLCDTLDRIARLVKQHTKQLHSLRVAFDHQDLSDAFAKPTSLLDKNRLASCLQGLTTQAGLHGCDFPEIVVNFIASGSRFPPYSLDTTLEKESSAHCTYVVNVFWNSCLINQIHITVPFTEMPLLLTRISSQPKLSQFIGKALTPSSLAKHVPFSTLRQYVHYQFRAVFRDILNNNVITGILIDSPELARFFMCGGYRTHVGLEYLYLRSGPGTQLRFQHDPSISNCINTDWRDGMSDYNPEEFIFNQVAQNLRSLYLDIPFHDQPKSLESSTYKHYSGPLGWDLQMLGGSPKCVWWFFTKVLPTHINDLRISRTSYISTRTILPNLRVLRFTLPQVTPKGDPPPTPDSYEVNMDDTWKIITRICNRLHGITEGIERATWLTHLHIEHDGSFDITWKQNAIDFISQTTFLPQGLQSFGFGFSADPTSPPPSSCMFTSNDLEHIPRFLSRLHTIEIFHLHICESTTLRLQPLSFWLSVQEGCPWLTTIVCFDEQVDVNIIIEAKSAKKS